MQRKLKKPRFAMNTELQKKAFDSEEEKAKRKGLITRCLEKDPTILKMDDYDLEKEEYNQQIYQMVVQLNSRRNMQFGEENNLLLFPSILQTIDLQRTLRDGYFAITPTLYKIMQKAEQYDIISKRFPEA